VSSSTKVAIPSYHHHVEPSLAIARIFGGFPRSFFEKYHEHLPKTEPADQYELRGDLYELYHYLNHTVLFGVCLIFALAKVQPDLYEEFLCRKCFAQD
jgi:fructosamine-3-kinase